MKFYIIWRTYSGIYSVHNCSCISNEACVTLSQEVLKTNVSHVLF